MQQTDVTLTGLDGTNPIGYLAALGVLRALTDQGVDARVGWRLLDAWRPVLEVPAMERTALLEILHQDIASWRTSSPELDLSYEKSTTKSTQRVYELKPPPDLFQRYAASSARNALLGYRRWADYVASYAAAHEKLGVDGNGNTKPTALHFSAGKQMFLAAVRTLLAEISRSDLEEAVFGPWRYERTLPVLGWDLVAGERDYALRATNPAREKKAGVPGADWLAFRGMAFFPVVLNGGSAVTTGFEGGGKRYAFHWALWEPPLPSDVVRTVTATRWDDVDVEQRRLRGILLVLRSNVRRTDQGGYGSFAAPRVQ